MLNFRKIVGEGLTFDDVLLVPAYSQILPRDVDISTRFTKNIRINALLFLRQWILLQNTRWLLQLLVKEV